MVAARTVLSDHTIVFARLWKASSLAYRVAHFPPARPLLIGQTAGLLQRIMAHQKPIVVADAREWSQLSIAPGD